VTGGARAPAEPRALVRSAAVHSVVAEDAHVRAHAGGRARRDAHLGRPGEHGRTAVEDERRALEAGEEPGPDREVRQPVAVEVADAGQAAESRDRKSVV